jgi:hypothetical protein
MMLVVKLVESRLEVSVAVDGEDKARGDVTLD